MGILDKVKEKVKSILPKRKEPELKNNVPKEKEHIRNTFGEYCNANHGTEGGKLLIKISRCPYGIGKPICEQCETPCFGERFTNDFNTIMKGGQKKMLLSHPIMTVKHKIAGLGAEYAKMQRDKKSTEKQKEDAEKLKNKFANATRSPKKSKSKKRKKK